MEEKDNKESKNNGIENNKYISDKWRTRSDETFTDIAKGSVGKRIIKSMVIEGMCEINPPECRDDHTSGNVHYT